MAGPAPIFKEIHRLRRYLKDLDEKLAAAPRQLKAQQNKLAQQQEAFKTAQEGLKQLKVAMNAKELQVKTTQAQLQKYEKQLEKAKNQDEYTALQHQIETGKQSISTLEDEILEMMAEVETKTFQLPELETVAKKASDDFSKWEKDQQEKLARFQEEKSRSTRELSEVEATLPADLKNIVLRLLQAKGADAMAGLSGTICSACYTEITTQKRAELNQGKYIECSCGRILYVE